MSNLRTERFFPIVGALIGGGVYFLLLRNHELPKSCQDLFSNVINLAGISIGFLATAQSIIFTLGRNRLLRQYQSIGYDKYIVSYFLNAIHWLLGLALLSCVALFIEVHGIPDVRVSVLLAVWCATFIGSVLSYYRVIRVIARIFRAPTK